VLLATALRLASSAPPFLASTRPTGSPTQHARPTLRLLQQPPRHGAPPSP
jgi:hypothetical protein